MQRESTGRTGCAPWRIPFEWQEAVIRAAITLKLCTYEDHGRGSCGSHDLHSRGPDSGRNWDYRYCWLRDATSSSRR